MPIAETRRPDPSRLTIVRSTSVYEVFSYEPGVAIVLRGGDAIVLDHATITALGAEVAREWERRRPVTALAHSDAGEGRL